MEQKGIAPLLVGIIILGLIAIAAIALLVSQDNGNQQGQTTPTPTPTQPGQTPTPTPPTKTPTPIPPGQTPTTGQPAETQGDSCTTADGSTGITGPAAVEGVLFKWDFESIQFDTCDTADKNMIFFCDPAQFALSLAERLEQIKKLAESGQTEKARALAEFSSLLIADNYSEDFQKDFADYYSGRFFETPAWFEPWAKYFADENRLQFYPRNIKSQGSGLYKVKLDFDFNEKEFEFFNNGMASAKITVEFSRLGDYNGNASVFHSIPINGMVGTTRKDADGKIERKDYGIGFSEGSQTLAFQEGSQKIVDSTAKGGLKEFQILVQDKFEQTNTKGGVIAFISEPNGIITFAPQYAKTVLALLKPKNSTADLFYWISENGKGIGQGKTSMAWWTAAGGTSLQQFQNLAPDVSASSTIACTNVKATGGNAFGFHITNLPQDKNTLLKSYFFAPFKNAIVLENGCTETAVLFTENEKITDTSKPLDLGGTENKISQFYELRDLAMKREICVVNKQGAAYFQWNAAVLEEQEQKALQLSGIKEEYASGQITPKGTTRQPARAGNRKIEIQQYKLFSGYDGNTKALFTPATQTDGEIYLIADASNLGIFCFERPLVEIYKIDGNNEELLLKAKSSGFLGLSPKEYRGSIKKGESLKLTARGFTKTLCIGSGSPEAYIAYASGTSGIAVAAETKEINSYCTDIWLAEYPDTEIAKCSIEWGDNSTTSTTELWPGPNVKPETGPHTRSHCYDEEDGPLSYSISYICEDLNGNSKSARLTVEVPVDPDERERSEGAYCTDCIDCCGAQLKCIDSLDYQPGIREDEKYKVCCPKETKWDGGLCLHYNEYLPFLSAERIIASDKNATEIENCLETCALSGEKIHFTLNREGFSAFRDSDWYSFIESQQPLPVGGDEVSAGDEATPTPAEDTPTEKDGLNYKPWPVEPISSPGPPEDGFGNEEPGQGQEPNPWSIIYLATVDIYSKGKQLDTLALSEELDGKLGVYLDTKGLAAGNYTARFNIYADQFQVSLETPFTIFKGTG